MTALQISSGNMDAAFRRKNLLSTMVSQEKTQVSCIGCSGTCCTYEANSMMVTPLEAFEMLDYLKSQNQLNADLKIKLTENVTRFRLDHAFGNGKRSFIRRTYTCPFFSNQSLGCPLPREIKPYGCLAFNPHHETLKGAPHCHSDVNLLEELAEFKIWEDEKNRYLKDKYQIYWDKSPIPTALLDIWDKNFSSDDLR